MEILNRIKISYLIPACFLLFSGSFTAQAAMLNLVLQTPDITSNFINAGYDADTDIFFAAGFATTLNGSDIGNGSFSLSADISAGGILNSGTISITGTSGIYNSGTLITGDLIDIGFSNDDNQLLEFLFTPTGGDLLSAYGSNNGGIILSASGYNGDDFNSDFASASYNAFSDTAPVPAPAALWLFGSGLLALVGAARRRG